MQISSISWWVGLLIGSFLFIKGQYIWTVLGLILVITVLIDFIYKIGRGFPLLELILLVAVLQLILGPIFAYRLPVSNDYYQMYISEREYMGNSVPALYMMLFGMSLVRFKFNIHVFRYKLGEFSAKFPKLARNIILIGLIASFFEQFFPISLRFLFYLATNLIYIGGLLYYLSPTKSYRLQVYIGSMIYALLKAASSGMFHDFILWLAIGVPLIIINLRWSFLFKFLAILIGVMILMTLQHVKQSFREVISTRSTDATESIVLLGQMIKSTIMNPQIVFTPVNLGTLNVRLNQGWITSAVFMHVPAVEPFANGSTIIESTKSALLPRILFPNKKTAGDSHNFRLYTGLPIDDNTSMGIGLISEAYINFGKYAYLFLFTWGYLLARIFKYFMQRSLDKDILLFFFIPLIFLHVIKAETEFLIVLNHLIKSIIFTLGLYYFGFAKLTKTSLNLK